MQLKMLALFRSKHLNSSKHPENLSLFWFGQILTSRSNIQLVRKETLGHLHLGLCKLHSCILVTGILAMCISITADNCHLHITLYTVNNGPSSATLPQINNTSAVKSREKKNSHTEWKCGISFH